MSSKEESLREARAAWPDVSWDDAPFIARLGDQVDPGLRVTDLYLVMACLAGNGAALRHLDERLKRLVPAAERIAPGAGEDVVQRVRIRLLDGEPPKGPVLAAFEARGDLSAWLRVVVTREALSERRRLRPVEAVAELPDLGTGDPELTHLRGQYGVACRDAFELATKELGPEERTLLRLYHVDRLTIDELATLYKIHRVTALRRVERAREALAEGTRRALAARFSAGEETLRSVLRLVDSELDVSVERLLRAGSSAFEK